MSGHGLPQNTKAACGWFEESGRMGFTRGTVMAKMLETEINAIPEPFSDILTTRFEFLLTEWEHYETLENLYQEAVEVGVAASDTATLFRSLFLFFQAALDGSQEAQGHLGFLFVSGTYVTTDYPSAAFWHQAAADQGYASSIFDLGQMCEQGLFFDQDATKALEHYEIAAEKGLVLAQQILGSHLLRGTLGSQDYPKALFWLTKAANVEDTEAQAALGYMYHNALGCEQDLDKATSLWMQAAQKGHSVAAHHLGLAYLYGWGVPSNPIEAFELLSEAARQENPESTFVLAQMYMSGVGVTADHQMALSLFQKASDLGHAEASLHLGSIYEYGEGVEIDLNKAKLYWQRAADLNHPSGIFNLGSLLLTHAEKDSDYQLAKEWLQKADVLGHPKAKTQLAALYSNGLGVEKDISRAIAIYREALKTDLPEDFLTYTEFNLADSLRRADSNDEFLTEALQIFSKLAHKGLPHSQRELAKLYWKGEGCSSSRIEAVKWAVIAEHGGDSLARSMNTAMQAELTPLEIEKAYALAEVYCKEQEQEIHTYANK
jgi:TPR repeat protein